MITHNDPERKNHIMPLLIDHTVTLRPENSKTNLILELPLDRDYDRLVFTCTYSPKYVEDEQVARTAIESQIGKYIPDHLLPQYGNWRDYLPLMNFVTLSVDYAGKYIGCAHRHAPTQQHIISADGSSPGFFRQAAAAGAWRVVLNIHAIISDEVVYHLTVTAHDKKED